MKVLLEQLLYFKKYLSQKENGTRYSDRTEKKSSCRNCFFLQIKKNRCQKKNQLNICVPQLLKKCKIEAKMIGIVDYITFTERVIIKDILYHFKRKKDDRSFNLQVTDTKSLLVHNLNQAKERFKPFKPGGVNGFYYMNLDKWKTLIFDLKITRFVPELSVTI